MVWFRSVLGIHSQALRIHAKANRLRHPSRRHNNCSASQQQKTAGETHHGSRNRNIRRSRQKEYAQLAVEILRLSIGPVYFQQESNCHYPGADM